MNDDDLRRRFGELRKEDAKHAPLFTKSMTGARPRARVHVLIAAMPVVAAAAILIVWCGTSTTPAPSSAPALVAEQRVRPAPVAAALPLDFLLESAPSRVRLDAEGLLP